MFKWNQITQWGLAHILNLRFISTVFSLLLRHTVRNQTEAIKKNIRNSCEEYKFSRVKRHLARIPSTKSACNPNYTFWYLQLNICGFYSDNHIYQNRKQTMLISVLKIQGTFKERNPLQSCTQNLHCSFWVEQ